MRAGRPFPIVATSNGRYPRGLDKCMGLRKRTRATLLCRRAPANSRDFASYKSRANRRPARAGRRYHPALAHPFPTPSLGDVKRAEWNEPGSSIRPSPEITYTRHHAPVVATLGTPAFERARQAPALHVGRSAIAAALLSPHHRAGSLQEFWSRRRRSLPLSGSAVRPW